MRHAAGLGDFYGNDKAHRQTCVNSRARASACIKCMSASAERSCFWAIPESASGPEGSGFCMVSFA